MLKAILCPIDFSEHSERALKHALDLAALGRGRVALMTVTDPLLDAAARAAGSHETSTGHLVGELGVLFEKVAGRRPDAAVTLLATVGEPAEQILRVARELPAELIVMGTQGLGAAARFFLGSTTEKVLRESPVPVLAVPPPEA